MHAARGVEAGHMGARPKRDCSSRGSSSGPNHGVLPQTFMRVDSLLAFLACK